MEGLSEFKFEQWKYGLSKNYEVLDIASLIWFWAYLDKTQDDIEALEEKLDLINEIACFECWQKRPFDLVSYRASMKKFTPFSDYIKYVELESESEAPGYPSYDNEIVSIGLEAEPAFCNTVEFKDHPILGNSNCTERYINLSQFIDRCNDVKFRLPSELILICSDDVEFQEVDENVVHQPDQVSLKGVDKNSDLYTFLRCRLIRVEYESLKQLSGSDIKNKKEAFLEFCSRYPNINQSILSSSGLLVLLANKNEWNLEKLEEFIADAFRYIWMSEESRSIYKMKMGDSSDKVKKIAKHFMITGQQSEALIRTVTPDISLNTGHKGDEDKVDAAIHKNQDLVSKFLEVFYR